MAVVIRMKRTGRRNRPCYRISVADKQLPRDGRTLETLGLYDPISPVEENQVRLDVERARHWLARGAKPSDTVRSLFTRQGVYEGQTPRAPRERPGRGKKTATRVRRDDRKAKLGELKEARRAERVTAKKAAAAATAQESSAE